MNPDSNSGLREAHLYPPTEHHSVLCAEWMSIQDRSKVWSTKARTYYFLLRRDKKTFTRAPDSS